MHRKTILVVDDEHPIREMIKSVLEIEGYKVLTASGGKECIELLKRIVRPCLILLDMVMPGMDGADCLKFLRGNPSTAAIPVIMISASDAISKPAGGVEHITKPFNLTTLLSVVKRHCT